MNRPRLHLASSSPRRHEILRTLGLDFSAAGVDLDESRREGELADRLVVRLAREKARAVAGRQYAGPPVLAADTLVVLDERIFGKPESENEAVEMLSALAARPHRVLTAVALLDAGTLRATVSETTVRFRDISPDEARAYWQTGEPQDKAGAYAIQGIGGLFVESIAGSFTGVVGLPVYETAALLQEAGIPILGTTHET